MNQFLEWLSRLFGSWKFWIIVPPWDIGVRIRLGKNAVALSPGPHWRVPFLDEVILTNTRLRITTTPTITIKTEEGKIDKVRTLVATVGYIIRDPITAMQQFEHPSAAVQALAQAEVAKNPYPLLCEDELRKKLKDTGVDITFVQFVEDVEIPAIRVLQSGSWISSDHNNGPPSDPSQIRY